MDQWDLPTRLIGLGTKVKQCQKQCQNRTYPIPTLQPLQRTTELHQKDLRIIALFLQISGSRNKGILEADTLLALSLIVAFSVSDGSY